MDQNTKMIRVIPNVNIIVKINIYKELAHRMDPSKPK